MEEIKSKTEQELTVGGYRFATKADAELAFSEEERIKQLEMRMDYAKPNTVYAVYTKAIENRVFSTPVGMDYLKNLQDYLYKYYEGDKDSILPIPLFMVFGGKEKQQETTPIERVKTNSAKKINKRTGNSDSVLKVIILALLIVIVGMFVITMNGTTPNILNYERVLQNKYASWEQELKQREDAIREKELELSIGEE